MYCPRCGETNPDSDRFCSFCGQDLDTYGQLWSGAAPHPAVAAQPPVAPAAPVQVAETPEVPTYLGWASALLALCWPAFWAAIPALVYGGRTESRLARGDVRGAWDASRKARTWCWVTLCAGCVLWVAVLSLVSTLQS